MKVFITGDRGFVGQHLRKRLSEHKVRGFDIQDGEDIRDYEALRLALDTFRPDRIYHLAAQAFVPESYKDPDRTFEVNTLGSKNLLEAVKNIGLKAKILLAGTSEEYGDGEADEESRLIPKSPYGISKAAMDHMGHYYAEAYGMDVVVTRAFNHTGPGRGEMYADSAWAKQIAEIEIGIRDVLKHGNLESLRNYSDVRDVVRAYELAIELPPGTYNICSDRNVSMQDVLNILLAHSKHEIKTELDTTLGRPSDFSFKAPNCEKFHSLTGWESEIPLEKTLKDLLDYWRWYFQS